MSKKNDILLSGKELIAFYRKNPVIAAEDLLGQDLAIVQQRMLEDMWFKNNVIVTAGRGTGKTRTLAVFAALYGMLYPGQKIGLLGPSFRQSKHIFAEVESMWSVSSIFREATTTKPIKASDKCYLQFRQFGTYAPSIIEAIPIGDGGKIRGARYYVILADEFAQIPFDIFNKVIMPMGAASANPMERARRLEKKKKLLERGIDIGDSFSEMTNKTILTSSAYYQFNHMYTRIKAYEDLIQQGETNYAVHNISYEYMNEGFMSEENIKNAMATQTKDQFRMEYKAEWISDSAGIFKASLIEACFAASKDTIRLKGIQGKEYVIGVDPART
jgi:hypothetical protein